MNVETLHNQQTNQYVEVAPLSAKSDSIVWLLAAFVYDDCFSAVFMFGGTKKPDKKVWTQRSHFDYYIYCSTIKSAISWYKCCC